MARKTQNALHKTRQRTLLLSEFNLRDKKFSFLLDHMVCMDLAFAALNNFARDQTDTPVMQRTDDAGVCDNGIAKLTTFVWAYGIKRNKAKSSIEYCDSLATYIDTSTLVPWDVVG